MLKKIYALILVVLCVILSTSAITTFAYDDEANRPVWEAKDLAHKAELSILIKGSQDPKAMYELALLEKKYEDGVRSRELLSQAGNTALSDKNYDLVVDVCVELLSQAGKLYNNIFWDLFEKTIEDRRAFTSYILDSLTEVADIRNEARTLISASANAQHPASQFLAASLNCIGYKGTNVLSYNISRTWLEAAASKGYGPAYRGLAYFTEDNTKKLQYYKKAYELGDHIAAVKGILNAKNNTTLLEWVRLAAECPSTLKPGMYGRPFHESLVGESYYSQYIPTDEDILSVNTEYEQITYKQEIASAQCCLGYLYLIGAECVGGKNVEKAKHYLSKASQNGNPLAMFRLGLAYQEGTLGEVNPKYVVYYVEKGLDHMYGYFNEDGDIEEIGSKVDPNYEPYREIELEKEALKQLGIDDNPVKTQMHALYALAAIYQTGNGVKRDIDKAKELFEKADTAKSHIIF